MAVGGRGWKTRKDVPDDEIRVYSLRMRQGLINDLKDLYPDMEVSEAIRFSIAYVLDKKPKVRLPVELTLKGTVIK